MTSHLYLVTEDAFHTSYLVNEWCKQLDSQPAHIIIRSDKPSLLSQRMEFHNAHAGKKHLSEDEWKELEKLYGSLSASERCMVSQLGIPPLPVAISEAVFVGKNLNASLATDYLEMISHKEPKPQFFVFLDQVLKHPAWLDAAQDGRVYNAHSAILPYAAGMYAIENIAALKNPEQFRKAAGATVHLVNPGVDEGAILKRRSLAAPFAYDSIWDVKAASYKTAFDLLIQLADDIKSYPDKKPDGVPQDMRLRLAPAFRSKDFTPEKRLDAEQGYLAMKEQEKNKRMSLV